MSFGGSGSKQTSQSQSQTYNDPTQTGMIDNYVSGLQGAVNDPSSPLSYKAYSGPGLNFGNTGSLNAASTYQAPQIAANQVTAGQIGSTDLSPYMNPYTSDVINATNADLARQGAIQRTTDAGTATSAGAFGGSRSAVLQNLDDESMQRAMASTDAGLRLQGFTQAQGAAGQDIASRLAADQGNQQAALAAAQGNQQASLASVQAQLQAQGITAQQAQALYGANWQQYLASQQLPQQAQALVNNAYSLIPTSPIGTSSSTGAGSSGGFNFGIPLPK